MSPFPIPTDRLLIRELDEGDTTKVLALAGDPLVMRYLPQGPDTEEDAIWFVEQAIEDQTQASRSVWYLGVEPVTGGELMGLCSLTVRSAHNREAEIGFRFQETSWGQGFATEAARTIIDFGFGSVNLRRIFGRIAIENAASAGVLRKLGMQKEGRLREVIQIRGNWIDHDCYAVLDHEWRNMQKAP